MILDAIFGTEKRGRFEPVTGHGIGKDATLNAVFGRGIDTASGQKVDEETCLGVSGVYAAVRLLCWSLGSLPLPEYEKTSDTDRQRRHGSRVAKLLNDEANPEMTGRYCREVLQYFCLQWGRGLAYVERDEVNRPLRIWPMHTSQVNRERNKQKQIIYDISRTRDGYLDLLPPPPTRKAIVQSWDMIDIPNLGGNSVVHHARESLGESMAAQELGSGFYAGGSLYAMAIQHPGKLSAEAGEKLRNNIRDTHGRQRKIAVLDEGMTLDKFGMPLKDAQFLESREFYVTEIARWYGIPPHKLRDLSRAHFNNITEQKLEWYEDLLPWLIRHESEYNRKLIPRWARGKRYVEYMVDNLLRGDIEKRYNAYEIGVRNGWLNRNDVRRKENMNTMGKEGDVFTVQSQNVSLETVMNPPESPAIAPPQATPPEPKEKGADDTGDKRSVEEALRGAARAAVLEAIEHAVDKEAAEIRRAAASERDFVAAIDKFYRNYLGKMEAILRPAKHVCKVAGVGIDPEQIAMRHCEFSRKAFLELSGEVTAGELVERVKLELAQRREAVPVTIISEVFGDE